MVDQLHSITIVLHGLDAHILPLIYLLIVVTTQRPTGIGYGCVSLSRDIKSNSSVDCQDFFFDNDISLKINKSINVNYDQN